MEEMTADADHQRLVELIFNQSHLNSVLENIGYNADKLPLRKFLKATLKQGFDYLNKLASLIKHPALAQNKYKCSQSEVIEDFSNKYYSTILYKFGRYRPVPINNNDILRQETAMLDTLTNMEVANTITKITADKKKEAEAVNMLDKRFQALNMDEMTPLDHKPADYTLSSVPKDGNLCCETGPGTMLSSGSQETRTKCKVCHKIKTISNFSNKQLIDLRHRITGPNGDKARSAVAEIITCRACTGGPVNELTCCICGEA
ncbi:MAG: hypothetical protein Q9218_002877 [Villophora microphyllina]